jgi:hypothetical protein
MIKQSVITMLERKVNLKISKKVVAEYLRTLGAYIPKDKEDTLYTSSWGTGEVDFSWEIGKVSTEESRELDGSIITVPTIEIK